MKHSNKQKCTEQGLPVKSEISATDTNLFLDDPRMEDEKEENLCDCGNRLISDTEKIHHICKECI